VELLDFDLELEDGAGAGAAGAAAAGGSSDDDDVFASDTRFLLLLDTLGASTFTQEPLANLTVAAATDIWVAALLCTFMCENACVFHTAKLLRLLQLNNA
jgi:hypothetical protein